MPSTGSASARVGKTVAALLPHARGFSQRRKQFSPSLTDFESVVQGSVGHTYSLSPLRKGKRHPIVFIEQGYTAVSCLLSPVGPSAVPWFVGSVVVHPINRHPARALTHVGKEVLKHLPSRANSYSASAVIGERFGVGVFASLPHAAPDVVRRRPALPVSHVSPSFAYLALDAPARLRSAISDVGTVYVNVISAVAVHSPYGTASLPGAGWIEGYKTPESLASKIDKFHLCNSTVEEGDMQISASGYDCSTPGNRRCPGVWARSQQRYQQCMQGGQ